MAQATLGDYAFPLDPENISWTFSVKTKVTYTIGGKVVQIFGTQLGPMTLSGSFGSGGFDAQEKFIDKMRSLAKAQGKGDNPPHRFLFPFRNWDFKVYIRSISTPDGPMAMHVTADTPNPRWSMVLQVVEENAGLKKVATDSYIRRLSEGIGWHPSEFNGPADYQAMLDEQAAYEASLPSEPAPTGPTTEDLAGALAEELND